MGIEGQTRERVIDYKMETLYISKDWEILNSPEGGNEENRKSCGKKSNL